MPIAEGIQNALASASMIRKMFEEGNRLKKQHGADNVFDFSLGNPDVDPPPDFYRILLQFAGENKKGVHGYMSNAGFTDVREAIAKKVSREHQVAADASHIVMSVGAAGGLNTVLKTVCNPGDEVIVSRPYFMEYRYYAANHGAKLVEADSLPGFDLDIGAIEAALSPKTAAVLINSPNNPTGKVYPATTIAALADALRRHGGKTGRPPCLVSDEPYREIAYGIEVPPLLCAYDEAIVVSSYSKSLSLPGERIGYIALSPEISCKDALMDGLIFATRTLGYVNAPALMQRIVAELTEARIDVSVYARRRDAFTAILDEAEIEYAAPEGAFYLFCKIPERKIKNEAESNDLAFVNHLKQHLILGVPGSGFGKPGWLRFAYCVDEKIIRASAAAFSKAMESW
ncbi:MAG: pyridoxal phosphate-dependent aminotransferase [Treponema sp.]|nr:pyridoxal phosphate-dependent aminotransferase [Treponema sp.]